MKQNQKTINAINRMMYYEEAKAEDEISQIIEKHYREMQ